MVLPAPSGKKLIQLSDEGEDLLRRVVMDHRDANDALFLVEFKMIRETPRIEVTIADADVEPVDGADDVTVPAFVCHETHCGYPNGGIRCRFADDSAAFDRVQIVDQDSADLLFLLRDQVEGGCEGGTRVTRWRSTAAGQFGEIFADADAAIGQLIVHVSWLELVGSLCAPLGESNSVARKVFRHLEVEGLVESIYYHRQIITNIEADTVLK